jgi:hypothetical protein
MTSIGYGLVSALDAIRYPLYLDSNNNAFFIDSVKKKYTIPLNGMYRNLIYQNKKLLIVLNNKIPREESFAHPTIEIIKF